MPIPGPRRNQRDVMQRGAAGYSGDAAGKLWNSAGKSWDAAGMLLTVQHTCNESTDSLHNRKPPMRLEKPAIGGSE